MGVVVMIVGAVVFLVFAVLVAAAGAAAAAVAVAVAVGATAAAAAATDAAAVSVIMILGTNPIAVEPTVPFPHTTATLTTIAHVLRAAAPFLSEDDKDAVMKR